MSVTLVITVLANNWASEAKPISCGRCETGSPWYIRHVHTIIGTELNFGYGRKLSQYCTIIYVHMINGKFTIVAPHTYGLLLNQHLERSRWQ